MLAPSLSSTRILRAYAGVRPLVASGDDPTGRSISRGIVCIDHEVRDGLKDFITITGGKLMTYRLMAEQATDLVCKKLNLNKRCETATTPLPGSEGGNIEEVSKSIWKHPLTLHKALVGRTGTRAAKVSLQQKEDQALICECEEVTVGEVKAAIERLDVHNLVDLRRRTRFGMGTCQGGLCALRAAGVLGEAQQCTAKAKDDLRHFLGERWKGIYPIAWGDALREGEYMEWVYTQVLGLQKEEAK